MTTVADAIRSKTGGSDPLSFPTGFSEAIEGISGGEPVTDPLADKMKQIAQRKGGSLTLTGDEIEEWYGTVGGLVVGPVLYDTYIGTLENIPGAYDSNAHAIYTQISALSAGPVEVTIEPTFTAIGYNSFVSSQCVFFNSSIDIDISGMESLKRINYFMYNCKLLNDLVIPEGVTKIEGYVVNGCSKIDNSVLSVTLPSTLTTIQGSYGVLYGTYKNDLRLIMLASNPPTLTNSGGISNLESIIVPVGSLSAYQTATNWAQFADKMVEASA